MITRWNFEGPAILWVLFWCVGVIGTAWLIAACEPSPPARPEPEEGRFQIEVYEQLNLSWSVGVAVDTTTGCRYFAPTWLPVLDRDGEPMCGEDDE